MIIARYPFTVICRNEPNVLMTNLPMYMCVCVWTVCVKQEALRPEDECQDVCLSCTKYSLNTPVVSCSCEV